MQVGEHRPFRGVRLHVRRDGQDAAGVGVAQRLEALVFLGCDGRDVLLDVRIHAVVEERNLRCMSGQHKLGPVGDGDVHRGTPFDAQAEPEHGLGAERTTITAHVGRANAVHRPECAPERLDRSVAVAHGDIQQVHLAEREVRPGERHPTTAGVFRQRHLGQRGEHPAQVILGRAVLTGQGRDINCLARALLDEIHQGIECADHVVLLSTTILAVRCGSNPIVVVGFDRLRNPGSDVAVDPARINQTQADDEQRVRIDERHHLVMGGLGVVGR